MPSARGEADVGITPISQLVNTLAFGAFALATRRFLTPGLQAVLVGFSLFFFRKRLRDLELAAFLHVLPILLFVFVMNCFRGHGEILARCGIFVLVKQGLLRGAYYCSVIVLLFVMSRLLTKGFGETRLLSLFIALSDWFYKVFPRIEGRVRVEGEVPGGFLLLLFYVLRMFQTAYSEMGEFFRSRRKGGDTTVRRRIIAYFVRVYRKAMIELGNTRHEHERPSARSSGLVAADGLYISLQAAVIAASLVFGR